MDFKEFDAQLREDVRQIQIVASQHNTEEAQIGRIQYIATAVAYCLMHRMGPLAAGYYLKQIADRITAEGGDHVH